MISPDATDCHIMISSPGPDRSNISTCHQIRHPLANIEISIHGQIHLPILEALGLVSDLISTVEGDLWRRSEECEQERKQRP